MRIKLPGETYIIAIAAAVCVVALLFAGWFVLIKPGQDRRAAAEAKAGQTVAEGQLGAAKAAGGTVLDTAEKQRAAEALTRENEDEIRATEGGKVVVGDDAQLAGLRSLCRRPTYSSDRRCRELFGADPAGVEGPRAGSPPAR